ncbi:hypothetical protein [Pseudonocardia nigra]|uniref:hypothetical protein n=1 Tax=Pseudonocardia nigra TaxID=1921578 RepID=UPI001C5D213B|nr:hypothetical protein [Pseudonocardia nigra]
MSYGILIALHAAAGVVAFAAGLAALPRKRFLSAYLWALVAMLGFLLLAVAVTAGGRDPANWAITGALVVLACVMLARAHLAAGRPVRTPAYVHHVGFGLVGLFDAFWVVALLRAGLPGWVVGAVAVGIAVAGHLVLRRLAAANATGRTVAASGTPPP